MPPFFFGKKGNAASKADAAAAASEAATGSVLHSEASANSNKPLFAGEVGSGATAGAGAGAGGAGGEGGSTAAAAFDGLTESIRSASAGSVRLRTSIARKSVDLARASVTLARDLAREFVEPPTQTSTLVRRRAGTAGSEVEVDGGGGGGAKAAAAAAVADLAAGPGDEEQGDGSHKQHAHAGRKILSPEEIAEMPKGTCEDGVRRRGNTFR